MWWYTGEYRRPGGIRDIPWYTGQTSYGMAKYREVALSLDGPWWSLSLDLGLVSLLWPSNSKLSIRKIIYSQNISKND